VAQRHAWPVVVALLILTTTSPLTSDQATVEDRSEPPEAPWVRGDWDWYSHFYAEIRWKHVPGLRLTKAKHRELWNRILDYAIHEDDGLGPFPESINFPTNREDRAYVPVVRGKTFDLVDRDGARALVEQYGQFDQLSVGGPWWRDVDFNSVSAWVGREVRLSDARREQRERGCSRSIGVRCSRSWGAWECEPTDRRNSNCANLAHNDRRWAELPGLKMTREKKHALWNRVLQQALVHEDWMGRPSGTIALNTEVRRYNRIRLDPDYEPKVAGATIELVDPGEILDLAEKHGQFEYVRLGEYHWTRGPVIVGLSISRKVALREARRARNERGCYRQQYYECTESEDDWNCRAGYQSSNDSDSRVTAPCD